MVVLALIVGVVLGALALWLWARAEIGRREAEISQRETEIALRDTEIARHKAVAQAADDRVALVERSESEKLALVEKSQGEWEERLRALTGEALERSSTSLLALADAKLAPIKETLQRFDEQARALEQKRLTATGTLDELLRSVADGQKNLQKETGNLVTALRAPHVRGRWGEVQLRRVIELAGMVAHCDFVEQTSERNDEGRLMRPDLVVRLPGGKNLVVDSKFSLDAFLDAAAAEDEETRRAHLQRHARLVREHMNKLGQKTYWKQFDPAPEFVVMFLGDESWFRAALDHDPMLLEAGIDSKVIPASPTTLIALLRTVAYGWQQETVAESARAVSRLGRELYERLGVFAGHFAGIGKSLDNAVSTYNRAVGSFESRVLVTARRFPELGAGADDLPPVAPVASQSRPVFAPEVETAEAETAKLATARLETARLETTRLETTQIGAAKPETAKPETAQLETVLVETVQLEMGQADSVIELPSRTADAA